MMKSPRELIAGYYTSRPPLHPTGSGRKTYLLVSEPAATTPTVANATNPSKALPLRIPRSYLGART